jgi:integrase
VALAQEQGVTKGRKMRVDTTVVEANIHYPTDSSLLGDGTRVLTRTMKKIESKSPRWGKNFLRWRIRPVARKLKIPEELVTFQVMRRTLGTDMQKHGTLKDVQGALRHASIQTTGDIYVQTLESSVQAAMNSRTGKVLKCRENIAAPQEAAILPKGRRMRSNFEIATLEQK